jgi:alpha-glucosidase
MREVITTTLLLTCLILLAGCRREASTIRIDSPDKRIWVNFHLRSGVPFYSVKRDGKTIIKDSRLGFRFKAAEPLDHNLVIVNSQTSEFDETWTQPWGEVKTIRNYYHELIIDLQETTVQARKMKLIFRVFNDGLGFRYELPQQENLSEIQIMDEETEFNLAGNYDCWWIPALRWNRYEYLYTKTKIADIDTVHTPFTMRASDRLYLSIHEANLTDYASMTLAYVGGTKLKCELVPWSDGIKVKGVTPLKTPWRTIQIAEQPGDLITSYMILNLNEPNKVGDVSWVKPAKYVGIWWAMHLGKYTWGSGPNHGATTANAKHYIDFAAKYGFDGVLVEGWNTGWDGDWVKDGDQFNFTQPHPDFDIEEVCRYAYSKGVTIIGHHETGAAVMNYEAQLEKAFAFYQKLGINMVKTGYVGHGQTIKRLDENGQIQCEWHHGQYMVRHYRKVVETAAKYHIMLDVHEPIKDTGIRRTYPNMLTREGARGMEYDAWSPDGGNPPDYLTILPFTRLLSGPMDFTPGIVNLFYKEYQPRNRVNTTLAKILAYYVIIYSPLQMAADLPENYEKHLDVLQFIRDVPVDWEETKVLNAEIGDYLTIVRKDRRSDDWYLGSVSDENGRELQASLDFLDPDRNYIAEIYRDAEDADWHTNPEAIKIEKKVVSRDTPLLLKLAPGGGMAVRFHAVSQTAIKDFLNSSSG